MMVELQDGRIYTGWRAVPWLLLFSPLIATAFLFGAVLFVVRWITGRDRVFGFDYDGHGTWRRVE